MYLSDFGTNHFLSLYKIRLELFYIQDAMYLQRGHKIWTLNVIQIEFLPLEASLKVN